ncbi:MAG: PepSY domain-containing protein [Methylovulum sp.]|nr:PepSY domain-containing protein [Methylovulum sp.]
MKTNHNLTISAAIVSLGIVTPCLADFTMPPTKVPMETCLKLAQAKKPGNTVKLEFKEERGTPIYEFNIVGNDGKEWEIECDANQGVLTEEEQEVSSTDDPLFKAKLKINEEEAKKIAIKAHPGEVTEIEYEIEANGDASYEFDIKTGDGKEVKLEIDAGTGKIVENNEVEIYQIGKE